jgi:hypothetical protein
MAAQDTLNVSPMVYGNDAYLAYMMTVDEESLGADATHSSATPALHPANAKIPTSTITTPPGDEIETTLEIGFGKVDTQTHSNTTSTLPPIPATDVAKISSHTLRHCLGTKESRLRILGKVDVQTLSSMPGLSPCVTEATSNLMMPSGEDRETEFGRVGKVDVQTHPDTLAVSPADTKTTTSAITMPPGDEIETTLDIRGGQSERFSNDSTNSLQTVQRD